MASCLAAMLLRALPTPPPAGNVTLSWDYPAAELSTNLTFKVYGSSDITVPMTSWTVLTNMVGTNTSVSLKITPGAFFFVMTSSNRWGESPFSNVASTPPLPRASTNLNISAVN